MEFLLGVINEMFTEAGRDPLRSLEQSAHLKEDLDLDSLMLAEFTVRVEEEFGVDIFEDGIVQTIGEVMAKIEGK